MFSLGFGEFSMLEAIAEEREGLIYLLTRNLVTTKYPMMKAAAAIDPRRFRRALVCLLISSSLASISA